MNAPHSKGADRGHTTSVSLPPARRLARCRSPPGELGATLSLRSYCEAVAWCPAAPLMAFAGDDSRENYAAVMLWAPPQPAAATAS
jgi:hypothetical protein